MRDKLRRQYTRPVTWNEVLSYFFTELKTQATRIKELEAQVEELGGKVEHKTEVIEEVLLNLSRQAAAPVMMQANPTMIQQPQTVNQLTPQTVNQLTPPPPPKQLPQYTPPDTGDLKQDLIQESKIVFDGQIRKPSEILHLCQPKHEQGYIKTFDGTEPRLEETSHIVKLIQAGSTEVAKFKKTITL
jgi:hypothetical protein